MDYITSAVAAMSINEDVKKAAQKITNYSDALKEGIGTLLREMYTLVACKPYNYDVQCPTLAQFYVMVKDDSYTLFFERPEDTVRETLRDMSMLPKYRTFLKHDVKRVVSTPAFRASLYDMYTSGFKIERMEDTPRTSSVKTELECILNNTRVFLSFKHPDIYI